MKSSLWVVEASFSNGKKWTPTVATSIYRGGALVKMAEWRKLNTGISHWRVAKYQRVKP